MFVLQDSQRLHRQLLPRECQESTGQGAAANGQGDEGALDRDDGEEDSFLLQTGGKAGNQRGRRR